MKYKSCEPIEQGIAFLHNYVTYCCNCTHKGGGFDQSPFMKYKGDVISVNWEEFFKSKDKVRIMNKGDNPCKYCDGCLYLMDSEWENDNQKLSYINLNHWKDCDTNCIYCGVKEDPKTSKIPQIYRTLKDLEKKGLIENKGMIMFGGGDISFLPEFTKIVKLFIKHQYRFNIATSATHFVPVLAELLKKGMVEVRISVDSANEETFKKIKRTEYFHTVWNNMKKYAQIQSIPYCVRSKFIIIPKVNDTKEEIDLWLLKTKKSNVHSVLLDIEASFYSKNRYNVPDYIFDLFEYAKNKATEMGLYFLIFDHASQMLSEKDNFLSDYYFFKDITQKKIYENICHKKENVGIFRRVKSFFYNDI